MPSRIIRESCRTSPNLNKVSAEAERLFWRMITVADDWGRLQADVRIILANCFPLMIHKIKEEQISSWVNELIVADLIKVYELKGRTYAYFLTWAKHQKVRSIKSKFPDPPNTSKQMQTNASVGMGYRVRCMDSKVLSEDMDKGEEGEKGPLPDAREMIKHLP